MFYAPFNVRLKPLFDTAFYVMKATTNSPNQIQNQSILTINYEHKNRLTARRKLHF